MNFLNFEVVKWRAMEGAELGSACDLRCAPAMMVLLPHLTTGMAKPVLCLSWGGGRWVWGEEVVKMLCNSGSSVLVSDFSQLEVFLRFVGS